MDEPPGWVRVRGARTHNLHNVSVDVPRGRLTVITGVSGSGKSSLAFDTIHAEGRRRYLETLQRDTRALFRQLRRPDVDLIEGLPPTVAVSQHAGTARARSTVATLTELHDHLRLLWARLGVPHCPDCAVPIVQHTVAEIVRATLTQDEGRKLYVLAPLVQNEPGRHDDVFGQMRQAGFLRARVDGQLVDIHEAPRLAPKKPHTIEVVVDRLVLRPTVEERLRESVQTAVRHGAGRVVLADQDTGAWRDFAFSTVPACVRCRQAIPALEPRLFNFNDVQGACPRCTGLGKVWALDPRLIVPDLSLTLTQIEACLRAQLPEDAELPALERNQVEALCERYGTAQPFDVQTPLADWPPAARDELLRTLVEQLHQLEQQRDLEGDDSTAEFLLSLAGYLPCPECGGARLNRAARAVRFADKGLHEITALSIDDAAAFFEPLTRLPPAEGAAAQVRAVLLPEIAQRLRFLCEVGLGYLTLDRPAPTLSGGEAQRARLATHLGGGLLGVCYVLDEPTRGLHPRDTDRLIRALRGLQERGNTVVVVEHDEAVIRAADHLIDVGPGAGRAGGRVLASGPVAQVLADPASLTATYLRDEAPRLATSPTRSTNPERVLTIRGARAHNLKGVDVTVPLGRWVCLTGVSGSGKSTLARDVLCYAARRHLGLIAPPPGAHDGIDGLDQLDRVIEVDQKPLGRSARSTPATCTGFFDEVRKVFAATRLAKVRGYRARRFSFNVRGGRCEECQGQGSLRVALQFLPELTVPCPVCRGARYNRATLDVLYRGRSIADVLALSVAEAAELFANLPALHRPLAALAEVGLGYITLGQSAGTLSGGEAQRVKLAAELARPATGRTLYLLDEPTTGLHLADVAHLVKLFRALVEAGNTLVVIEHHLDMIAAADWVIDLGPEGGVGGGHVLAAGTPAQVADCPASITGRYLKALRTTSRTR